MQWIYAPIYKKDQRREDADLWKFNLICVDVL